MTDSETLSEALDKAAISALVGCSVFGIAIGYPNGAFAIAGYLSAVLAIMLVILVLRDGGESDAV